MDENAIRDSEIRRIRLKAMGMKYSIDHVIDSTIIRWIKQTKGFFSNEDGEKLLEYSIEEFGEPFPKETPNVPTKEKPPEGNLDYWHDNDGSTPDDYDEYYWAGA